MFKRVLKSLESFCLNKIHFSSPENRFQSENHFRQKYMRELYILDLLVEILKLEIPEHESKSVFKENQYATSLQSKSILQRALQKQKNKPGGRFLLSKIAMQNKPSSLKVVIVDKIFSSLMMICRNNARNQIYFYKLVPKILYFVSLLPLTLLNRGSTSSRRPSASTPSSTRMIS